MEDILAVIITYNIDKNFIKVVDSIENQVKEILVVDNGSKNESIQILRNLHNRINLIELGENMGIAYALNRGIEFGEKQGFQWILTLDHDSIAKQDMINTMLHCYEELSEVEKDRVIMITPRHVEEKNFSEEELSLSNMIDKEYVLTEITSGSLVKTDYYKNNKYEEKLFIDLVDHDFCLNINLQGKKILRCNSAVLFHNLGESAQKKLLGLKCVCTNHSAIRRYYMSRNRLYVWKKYKNNFPNWVRKDKLKFLSETGKVILFEDKPISKLKMTLKGIKDYRANKFGPIDI